MTKVLAFRSTTALVALVLLITAVLATAAAAAPSATCPVCGKNLIKNPGAEGGAGITAVGAFGALPGWTNEAGQFGAASYTFPNGWFSARSKGSPKRGRTTSSEARQPRPSRRRRRSASRRSTFRPPRLDARRRSAAGSATT